MSDLSYKIEIDGVQRVITSISEANKVIKQLTAQIVQAKEAGQDFTQTAMALQKALDMRQGIANISKGLGDVTAGLHGSQSASSNAASALLNLNYVIRDSPYFFNNFALGVMAVGNNINPLIDSFTILRQKAGERTISTFALLKQALVGGAGISIAFSSVATAIQSYVFWMSKAESQSKKTKEEVSETVKALQSLIDVQTPSKTRVFDLSPEQLKTLISRLDTQIKGLESTQEEIQKAPQTIGSENTKVKLDLSDIAKNVENQKNDNKEIVNELKKQKTELEAQLKVKQILNDMGVQDIARQKDKIKGLKEEKDIWEQIKKLEKEYIDWLVQKEKNDASRYHATFAEQRESKRPPASPITSAFRVGGKEAKDLNMNLEMGKLAAQQLGDALAQAFEQGTIKLNQFLASLAAAIAKMLLLRAITAFLSGGGSATASPASASIAPKIGNPNLGSGVQILKIEGNLKANGNDFMVGFKKIENNYNSKISLINVGRG